MQTTRTETTSQSGLLMAIAFLGIFVYGLLTALPGTVLPELEHAKYLENDDVAGTFLFINAIGAVIAYLVSGPLTDKLGKKFTLATGALLVIASMVAFALVVTNVAPQGAKVLVFLCGMVLGLGANAIVSAGHALVGDVAVSWRDSALNVLDIFFGLGLTVLPLIKNGLKGGIEQIFWVLGAAGLALLIIVLIPKFPQPTHPESFPFTDAKILFKSLSFWLLAIALFMYVGSEVAVGKWVVTFIERDARLLSSFGLNEQIQEISRTSADFFKTDPLGIKVESFALKTFALFGFALMIGRLISSFLLGIVKMHSFLLVTLGAILCVLGLAVAFNSNSPDVVRWGVFASAIGMGPIFPTSVGLASVIAPRIAGTAMSWVMGLGFCGLLIIPPAVGKISYAIAGEKGDIRTGLLAVLVATVLMLLLHLGLLLRERRRAA
jgi:fucose permease